MTEPIHPVNLVGIAASYQVALDRMWLEWAKYKQARHDGRNERRHLLRFARSLRASNRIRASLGKHYQEGTL